MSAGKPRKAGQPVYRKPQLRLVPSPKGERKPLDPDPEMKELFKELNRARRVRLERDPEDKDAA